MNQYILWGAVCAGVGVLFLLGWFILDQMKKKADFNRSANFIFLQIMIPKKESKEDRELEGAQIDPKKQISIAEDFFKTLYGIYSGKFKNHFINEDFLSFEYIASDNEIKFFVGCPRDLQALIEKQITSFYPEAIIEPCEPPNIFAENAKQAATQLVGNKTFYHPIKTYKKFEAVDPMNNLLNTLSAANDEHGNSAGVQIMIRPVADGWQKDARKYSKELSEGESPSIWRKVNPLRIIANLFSLLLAGADESDKEDDEKKESEEANEATQVITEKADHVAFETVIRVIASAPYEREAEVNLSTLTNAFTQFSGPNFNGFSSTKWENPRKIIRDYILRIFSCPWHAKSDKLILNVEEIASLFHFPHIRLNKIPGVKWQNFKVAKSPQNIPKEGILLGHNVYRGKSTPIYMKREDRFRHFYVIGQTGTGKSCIFQNIIRQDFRNGDGLCVVDPHGSLVEDVLPYIPRDRIDDVIIFNPADIERPMGLNLLEAKTEEEMDMVALDAMNIMIKIFNEETFGPRIQDYFRNGCLTLMAHPDGGCLTDVLRLFTDDVFQKSRVQHVKNPVVKSFWTKQMAATGKREQQEMIPYFAAKFGQFTTNGMMRNILGQTKSAFDFSQVMDEGKILMMNLSKGMTGDMNSKLLGLIIVNKIQMAALRRQKDLTAGKKPRDFFLYIDEFQNYVTDSLESILSEARKYRLSLNIAHQYTSQIDTAKQGGKGVNLKDAVFGNVGSMMCYKIGPDDGEIMAKQMQPVFTDQDLTNQDAFKAAIKICIDGQPSIPFSLNVVKPWLEKGDKEIATAVKQISRLTHARSKKFVEKEIFTRLDV
ncbi:hypothetical protein CSB37_01550 [bacterium DOLZORAL124_38_8]|nr:MAG: hypothetical protein CSB37_01550 [bacterium DOLZORAL124_38_8]